MNPMIEFKGVRSSWGHAGQERRLHAIGLFRPVFGHGEFGGAIDDTLFQAGLRRPQLFFGPFPRRDVRANASVISTTCPRWSSSTLLVQAIQTRSPFATNVLVDVLLECRRVGAYLVHPRVQASPGFLGLGDDCAHHMATAYLLFRVAEEPLAELVEIG